MTAPAPTPAPVTWITAADYLARRRAEGVACVEEDER